MTQQRTVDVLVIGATIAGLTTAVAAAAAGAAVLVIDPGEITRFGTGLVTVAMGSTLREVELSRGIPAAETMVAEVTRATDWLGDTLPLYGAQLVDRTAYSLAVDGHLAFHLRQDVDHVPGVVGVADAIGHRNQVAGRQARAAAAVRTERIDETAPMAPPPTWS